MNFYDDLVMQTQMNYSRHYHIYASGSTPYQLTDKKPLPYSEQIHRLVQEVKEADCVVVGGASGLSAAGGGDFYYEDSDSYRKYFRPFAEKSIGGISQLSFTPPRPHLCVIPIWI